MNRKIILFSGILLFFAITLAGCGHKTENSPVTNNSLPAVNQPVAETGMVIDLSEKNGQTITTTPGDVLYIRFTSTVNFKQHSISSADAAAFVTLKDEEVKKEGEGYINEWWFKVEKTGEFEIKFDYGAAGKKPEQIFRYNVVSL